MEHSKLEHFKKQLEDELALVEGELKSMGRKDPETGEWDATPGVIDDTATEPDEVADKLEDLEENQNEVAALEERERAIKHALEKIGAESYGVCEVCGADIETERLEANPSATTCVAHR